MSRLGLYLVDEEDRHRVDELMTTYEEHTGRPAPFSPLETHAVWREYSQSLAAGWIMAENAEEVVRVIDRAREQG